MSPGFSPLGRRQKKRLEGALTGDAPPQPSTARRRHAQRSLVFGAAEPLVWSFAHYFQKRCHSILMSAAKAPPGLLDRRQSSLLFMMMLILQKRDAEEEQTSQASPVKQSDQSQNTAADASEPSEGRNEPTGVTAPADILKSHASSEAFSEGRLFHA